MDSVSQPEKNSSLITEVRDGYERGWSFTPLNGKRPKLNGWQAAPREALEQALEWSAEGNVGLRTGQASGVVVLDVDDTRLPAGLPHTPIAVTGSGHYHVYFKAPAKPLGNRAGIMIDNVKCDIRGDGGQVVFVGSKHPSTGLAYRWEDGHSPAEIPLADWPDDLIPEKPHAVGKPVVGDASRALTRCMAYVSKLPPAISGQGGHNATLHAACECVRFDLSDADSIAVLHDYNSRCEPPWSEKELRYKLDEAKKVAANERGSRLSNQADTITPEHPAKKASARELLERASLLSDIGNAARLALAHGKELRYVYATGHWLVYDGKRWRKDDTGHALQLAKKCAVEFFKDSATAIDDDVRKWAAKSMQNERLSAALRLAAPDVAVRPDALDADPWALNCLSGIVDLRTGTLRPHDAGELHTKLAPVDYHPDAPAPTWERFLGETFQGDVELIEWIQCWHGYCLAGDIAEQILPIYFGGGANGKSTLLDTIAAVMGDYAGQAAPGLLTSTPGQQAHPTELADLMGKRLVIASETEHGAELRLQLAKRLTGDAVLKARFMRQDYFEFPRTNKTILQTNNKPVIREDTEASWRRIRLVPFAHTVPEAQRDPRLGEKLRNEAPGILAWLVKGCMAYISSGLGKADAVVLATAGYRAQVDDVGAFVDSFAWEPGTDLTSADVYGRYAEFAKAKGVPPRSPKGMAQALKSRGFESGRTQDSRYWRSPMTR